MLLLVNSESLLKITLKINSKSSAVKMGYYKDSFIQIFTQNMINIVNPSQYHSKSRSENNIMQPLMNRGYYARISTIRSSVVYFLNEIKGKQIVSFGAGFDTLYFVLKVSIIYFNLN